MADRPISQRNRQIRMIKKIAIWLVGILIIFFVGRSMVGLTKSSVSASRLIIVKTEVRNIQAGFRATGVVRSAKTKTLVAPFNSSIEKIRINNGESVESGTVIMELSTQELQKRLVQLNDEKLLMVQEKQQLQKDLAYHLTNNELNQQHDSIQMHNLKSELEQLKQLYKIGGTPYESVKQAEMKLQMSQIEYKQSKLQLTKQVQDKTFEVNQLVVNIRLHNQKIADVNKLIQQAMLAVPYSGVIQKINVSAGENVSQGMPLAIIASSDNIEVACETGSTYSNELFEGQHAIVKFGDNSCSGTVIQIDQSMSNNNVRFLLSPDSNADLKLNQPVQVQVITRMKDSVLCIPRRNYYTGPGVYNMYIVNHNEAVKQPVRLGMSNFEFVEVLSKSLHHSEIIIDGIPEYIKKSQFQIKY